MRYSPGAWSHVSRSHRSASSRTAEKRKGGEPKCVSFPSPAEEKAGRAEPRTARG